MLCQEPHPERYDVGGAGVVRPDVGGLLPVFVLDHYEGYHVRLLQDCPRPELDAWVEANAATVREYLPADFVLCNHVLLGGAVGQASGARYAVKAHGSELEYSMRGRPELEGWGREVLASATATFVGSAHIREVVEDVCGHVDRVHEVPPGVDIEEWRPRARDEALSGARRRGAPRSGEPGQRERTAPRRGERRAPGGVPRRRRAYRRLLREAPAQQGRPRAPRGARRRRRAGGDRRIRRLQAGARGDGSRARALHRAARAPAPRPPARTSGRVCRAVDLPGGLRYGRRRGGRGRVPSARRAPLGPRRGCGGARG